MNTARHGGNLVEDSVVIVLAFVLRTGVVASTKVWQVFSHEGTLQASLVKLPYILIPNNIYFWFL